MVCLETLALIVSSETLNDVSMSVGSFPTTEGKRGHEFQYDDEDMMTGKMFGLCQKHVSSY